MELCPSLYTQITGSDFTYFVIFSSFAFSLTLFGSLSLIKTCLKSKIHPAIVRLVFYTAIWDILFAVSIMFYQLNSGTENSQVLCFVYMIHYIAITCSLACTATITVSGVLMSRNRQNQFQMHYKLFLFITYVVITCYFALMYLYEFMMEEGTLKLILQYTPGTILYLVICFGTMRQLTIIKRIDSELIDKTSIYLSVTMLIFYTTIFVADWMNVYGFNYYWYMLANFLKLSAGFVNYLVGYKRAKKVIDDLNETPRKITIETNQSSMMFRNDLYKYLNSSC
jgi:hypothetical protein